MNNRDELRKAFSERLNTTLANMGKDTRGRGIFLQKELDKKGIKISTESIRKWLSGLSIPAIDNLTALAKIGKVSPAWLQYGLEEKSNVLSPSNVKLLGVIEYSDKEEILIPLIEESVTNNKRSIKESTVQKYRFSKQLIESLGISPSDVKCIKVMGYNMERLIVNESFITIDISDNTITDGEIYAIEHNGMLRICYLYHHPSGIRIRHENTQEYPDETIAFEQILTVKILGRVFWLSTIRHKKS